MKLFEASWRNKFEFYERYFDTELKKSIVKKIDLPYEWFEPCSTGLYTSVLDKTLRLEKKQGSAKQGRQHYGFLDPMYRNIRDNYWGKNAYNLEPRIFFIDIETRVGTCSSGFPVPENPAEPISLIQVYDNKSNVLFVLGLRDWIHERDYHFDYSVKYIRCENEIDLIEKYLSIFKKLDPLIIYAWFGSGFDFPYIHNRLEKLGLDPYKMSNYGNVSLSVNEYDGKTEFRFTSEGHFYIDLEDVYKKFIKDPRPNYKLDTIAEIELGEKKVQHSEYVAFDDFYTGKYIIPKNPTEKQKNSKIYQAAITGNWSEVKELAHSEFVYYGITDTYLIKHIDEKLNFTAIMTMIAEKMGVQIGDAMGTVKPWSQYIANKSMLNSQVMPPRRENNEPNIVGGYVRDPQKGKHKWVLSADVNSMYSLLGIVGFNMSPETFIPKYKLPPKLRDIVLSYFNDQEESERFILDKSIWNETTRLLKEYNLSLAINGAVFSRDSIGMIPEMVQEIYDSRKIAKKTSKKYEKQKVLIKHILKERHG